MSTTAPTAPQAQADAANAYAVFEGGAYLPTFLQKCAAAGFPANTEEEVQQLLQISQTLRSKYDAHQKSASSKVIARAHQQLVAPALAKQAAVQHHNQAIDRMVDATLQDPTVSASLDVLLAAQLA